MQPLLRSRYYSRRGGLLTWFLRTCINKSVMARFVYLYLSSDSVHVTRLFIHAWFYFWFPLISGVGCMLEK